MKHIKKIITLAVLFVLAGAAYGWYLFNKQPADVRQQTADTELAATDLVQAFKDNEPEAGKKYIDKILVVSGNISNLQIDSAGKAVLSFDTGDPLSTVTCSFYQEEATVLKGLGTGMPVRIKGVCNGMLSDVLLNKCSLVK